MGSSALIGPMLLVAFPLLFSVIAMQTHPLGAVLMLPAILYVANRLLLVPRYVEVDSQGLTIAYWLRRQHLPVDRLGGARTASSQELQPYWGILLSARTWPPLKVHPLGPVRIVATEFRGKYALILLTAGRPLLVGCDLPGGLVVAVRAVIAGDRGRGSQP